MTPLAVPNYHSPAARALQRGRRRRHRARAPCARSASTSRCSTPSCRRRRGWPARSARPASSTTASTSTRSSTAPATRSPASSASSSARATWSSPARRSLQAVEVAPQPQHACWCATASSRSTSPRRSTRHGDPRRHPRPAAAHPRLLRPRRRVGRSRGDGAQVAEAYPHGSVVIVGEHNNANTDGMARLRALPNVHFLGRKPYAELPGYCKAFDVALLAVRQERAHRERQPAQAA